MNIVTHLPVWSPCLPPDKSPTGRCPDGVSPLSCTTLSLSSLKMKIIIWKLETNKTKVTCCVANAQRYTKTKLWSLQAHQHWNMHLDRLLMGSLWLKGIKNGHAEIWNFSLSVQQLNRRREIPYLQATMWAGSCEKGPDDIFCPFLVLSFFAHFILQTTWWKW